MKILLKSLISFSLMITLMLPASAQEETDFVKNTQADLMIVAGAGAGGAILGLSTLSFYETPSKHIRNVWTGAALGVIAGVIFVAYTSAQKGSEELVSQSSSEGFSTSERTFWHQENDSYLTMSTVQFGTTFWQTTF